MQYFVRFPGFKKKTITTSFDDGPEEDIRVIEYLKRVRMKGTFFLNGGNYSGRPFEHPHRHLRIDEAKDLYLPSGNEIGIHTLTHPFPALLPQGCAAYEFIKDREVLEHEFGEIIRGMAYPMGSYNEDVIAAARLAGLSYARITPSTYTFNQPQNWYTWSFTCRFHDIKLFNLCEQFLNLNIEWDSKILYVFAHAYEFDDNDSWDIFERFCRMMGDRDDIWYATNIEICDYLNAASRMISSIDETRIFNPTSTPIWIEKDGNKAIVNPGEGMEIGA